MSSFLKSIRQPLGAILPLEEVKRRVIVDALDKCGGNCCLAARSLGIGKTTVEFCSAPISVSVCK